MDTCIGFSPLFLQLQVMLATANNWANKGGYPPQLLIFGYSCTVDSKAAQ